MIPTAIIVTNQLGDLPNRAVNAEAIAKINGGYYNKHRSWIGITDSFGKLDDKNLGEHSFLGKDNKELYVDYLANPCKQKFGSKQVLQNLKAYRHCVS